MKMKKVAASVLAASMVMTGLTGCGGGASSSGTTQAPAATTGDQGETQAVAEKAAWESDWEKISEEPITIRIFAPKGAEVVDYGEMDYIKKYCEATNINVIWEQPTQDMAKDRLNVIIASGDLPDMFWGVTDTQYEQLRQAGAIAPIQDYLDECPNLQKMMEEHPETRKYMIEPDGNMYAMPLMDGLTSNNPMVARKDWLDQLGMEAPVTKADWEAFWIAVRDNDLNGNGDPNDEIPLSGEGMPSLRLMVSAFEMLDGFFVDVQDGSKIKFSPIDSRYKEYITWLNHLWNEKLIDPNIFTTDKKILSNTMALNIVGSYQGKLNGTFNTYLSTLTPNIEGFDLVGTQPIMSDNGMQLHPGVTPLVRMDKSCGGGVVSITSKYPKECVKFCDWFYDATAPTGGAFLDVFGYEGVTFEYNEDKTDYFYTDWVLNNPDGLSPQQALMKYTTRGQYPGFVPAMGSLKMWHPQTLEAYENIEPFYEESLEYTVPTLPFTDEQNKKIRSTMADINTYVDETVAAFMTGKEPLDNFDNFVATVEKMGIQDILDIYNEAYAIWNQER